MRVAAVQLNSGADRVRNLEIADRLTRAAARDGAQLIVLPEKWTAMGTEEQLLEAAEGLDGPTVEWARALAGELAVDLVPGSFLERIQGREKLANTSVHIGPEGDLRAVYRKLHMFDVEVDGRVYRESDLEDPGEEIVTSASAAGVGLGMSICYDLRFPELFRILALRGARVVVLPSAFTLATTRDHWETLVRARAIENQVFLVAANQFGRHPDGHSSGGRSLIVDPWGIVLAQMGDEQGHILADLDLQGQRDIRARLPVLENRRPRAYRWPADSLQPLQAPDSSRPLEPSEPPGALEASRPSRPLEASQPSRARA